MLRDARLESLSDAPNFPSTYSVCCRFSLRDLSILLSLTSNVQLVVFRVRGRVCLGEGLAYPRAFFPSCRSTYEQSCCSACLGDLRGTGLKRVLSFFLQLHGVYLSFQKLVASRTVSWKAFFHLPSFERPRTGATVVDRIERNFRYFYMNYLLICSALAVVAALLNPVVLLVAGACGGAAIAAGLRGETVRLGSTVVPLRTFRVGCAAVGALTVLLVAGHIVAVLLFACTVVVLLHASLHVGVSYEQLAQRAADDAAFEV